MNKIRLLILCFNYNSKKQQYLYTYYANLFIWYMYYLGLGVWTSALFNGGFKKIFTLEPSTPYFEHIKVCQIYI